MLLYHGTKWIRKEEKDSVIKSTYIPIAWLNTILLPTDLPIDDPE